MAEREDQKLRRCILLINIISGGLLLVSLVNIIDMCILMADAPPNIVLTCTLMLSVLLLTIFSIILFLVAMKVKHIVEISKLINEAKPLDRPTISRSVLDEDYEEPINKLNNPINDAKPVNNSINLRAVRVEDYEEPIWSKNKVLNFYVTNQQRKGDEMDMTRRKAFKQETIRPPGVLLMDGRSQESLISIYDRLDETLEALPDYDEIKNPQLDEFSKPDKKSGEYVVKTTSCTRFGTGADTPKQRIENDSSDSDYDYIRN